MSDCIKREDAIAAFANYLGATSKTAALAAECILKPVHATPVREVKPGNWVRVDSRSTVCTYRCSECNFYAHMDATNFCPNCGADMRPGKETGHDKG